MNAKDMNVARPTRAACAVALSLGLMAVAPVLAQPVPQGGWPGGVTFDPVTNTISFNGNHVSVDYSSFNLPEGYQLTFNFGNPIAGRILNRVVGDGASFINGSIVTSGPAISKAVYIVNPHGIIFGPTASVNVAGVFGAVAGQMTHPNWNAAEAPPHSLYFTNLSGEVNIQSGATITAGHVLLAGKHITNAGSVDADGSVLIFASNDTIRFTPSAVPGGYQIVITSDVEDLPLGPGVQNLSTGAINAGYVTLGAGDVYSTAMRLEAGGQIHGDSAVNLLGTVRLGMDPLNPHDQVEITSFGNVLFSDTVDGSDDFNGGLSVIASNSILFMDSVGALHPIGSLYAEGSNILVNGDGVWSTGDQFYRGNVILGSVQDQQLVASDGSITVDNELSLPTGNIITIDGRLGVNLNGAVHGPGGLLVRAEDGTAFFGGNVGEFAPLAILDVVAGQMIIFQPQDIVASASNLIINAADIHLWTPGFILFDAQNTVLTATGVITLNDGVVIAVPEHATIGAAGNIAFNATDFTMGKNQKLTALGNLMIDVTGTATIGDLNAFEDINVTANLIRIQRRDPTFGSGGQQLDDGVDIIAGGLIIFNGSVIMDDGSEATLSSITESGRTLDLTDLLRDGIYRDLYLFAGGPPPNGGGGGNGGGPPPPNGGNGGGPPPPPNGGNGGEDITPPSLIDDHVANASGDIDDPEGEIEPGPVLRQLLARLGVFARELEISERLNEAAGLLVIDDTGTDPSVLPADAGMTVTLARLDSRVASRVRFASFVNNYYPEDGEAMTAAHDNVRESLARAWSAFANAGGAGADEFGEFLCNGADEAGEAREHVQAIHDLEWSLQVLGFSRAEARTIILAVARDFGPEGLSPADMLQVMEAVARVQS
jgi:filamentous hemagglutinin family protein